MINKDELLFVVDEKNEPVMPESREVVHHLGFWHRISHLWILNNHDQLLCQKRSNLKDKNPGEWEAHFGGHVLNGKTYIETAIIEIHEEIGLIISEKEILFLKEYKNQNEKEFEAIFYTHWNGDMSELKLEKDEVAQIKWVAIPEIERQYEKQNNLWVWHGYEKSIIQNIKNLKS